jgi:hypothetical protein
MSASSLDHKARATHLLVHYLETIAGQAGMRWDPDYTVEIVAASVAEFRSELNDYKDAVDQEILAVRMLIR